MDFETFTERLAEDLRSRFEGSSVRVAEVEKLQGQSYRAVTVCRDAESPGINVDATAAFREYNSGTEYGQILEAAVRMTGEAMENMPPYSASFFSDYENIRGRLMLEVVSTEHNREMLGKIPHREIGDMSVVYRISMDRPDGDSAVTSLVTNAQLRFYGVTPEQLHEDAVENAGAVRPAVFRRLSDVLGEMTGMEMPAEDPGAPGLVMASVQDGIFGAGVIAYPGFMEEAAKEMGGSFYLLPSSLHEVLLFRDTGDVDAHALDEMVKSINETVVSPEDRLSDTAYHYDAKDRVFERAAAYAERSEKEQEISVLKVSPNRYPETVTVGNRLEDLQAAVGGNIEVVSPFDGDVVLIVNENGKLEGLTENRSLRDTETGEISDIIAGVFIVAGTDGGEFRSLTPKEAEMAERIFHQPETFLRLGKGIISLPLPDEMVGMLKEKADRAKGKLHGPKQSAQPCF